MEHDPAPSYGDLAAFLRRGLAVALAAAIVAAAATYLATGRIEPTYEATATLLVAQPNPELRALAGGVVTPPAVDVSVYGAAATTDSVVAGALERLGVEAPTREQLDAFRRRLDARFDETRVSSLLHIRVRSGDAVAAADEANAVAASIAAWDAQRAASSVQRVVETLEGQVRGLEEQIAALRASGAAGAEIDERLALRETQRSQLALARTLQTRTLGLLETFEPARPPRTAAAPRRVRDSALAAVAAAILAYALLLVRSATDARFRSPREVGRALDLPVLSEFPPLSGRSRSREATSFLRTNLQLATGGRRPAVFLLTAPDATTSSFAISFSLAESFARNGERTLLIDSNLRQTMPKGGPAADVGVQPSLRAHLEDPHAPIRPAALELGAGVDLDFIASFDATPYASELLSRSMGHLLERALERYDVIVLDAAPVLAVADGLILAPHATGVVLVANVATLTRAGADEALARLAPVRERLAGVVATEVRGAGTAAAAAMPRPSGRDGRVLEARPAAVRARQKAKPGLHHR